MGRRPKSMLGRDPNNTERPKIKPATTLEGRENQLIALAVDLAEEQLRNGTASSQVITHYLKLGSTTERLEQKMKAQRIELDAAKTEAIQSAKHIEELYTNAIAAMRDYSGLKEDQGDGEDY